MYFLPRILTSNPKICSESSISLTARSSIREQCQKLPEVETPDLFSCAMSTVVEWRNTNLMIDLRVFLYNNLRSL